MESAVVGGAIAEESHRNVIPALGAGAHPDPHRLPDAGSHDAVGAEQPDRAVVEMHRPAATPAQAVALAEELRHDPPRLRALGQRVAVAAMRRRHPVGRAEMRADAGRDSLLADVEMQETGGLALAAGDLGSGLKSPQQHHVAEQPDQRRGRRHVR